jgi:hypothetical protein
MEILLLKGFNDLEFGLSKDGFLEKYSQFTNFEIVEEDGEYKTEAIYMPELETSIYFEGDETEMAFTACETENPEALLFGVKIFKKSEAEITKLIQDHKFSDLEIEIEEWGEKRVSFYDAMVDFYFEDGMLTNVSWGILIL